MKYPIATIYITKYALTEGILIKEAEIVGGSTNMAIVKGGIVPQYYHRTDWHYSHEAAARKAREMRAKKITALEKQIAKLKKLSFEPVANF